METKEGREVDFVTIVDGKVIDLIEVKQSDTIVSSSLLYYAKRFNPQNAVQLVATLKQSFHKDNILISNFEDYFKNPPWQQQ